MRDTAVAAVVSDKGHLLKEEAERDGREKAQRGGPRGARSVGRAQQRDGRRAKGERARSDADKVERSRLKPALAEQALPQLAAVARELRDRRAAVERQLPDLQRGQHQVRRARVVLGKQVADLLAGRVLQRERAARVAIGEFGEVVHAVVDRDQQAPARALGENLVLILREKETGECKTTRKMSATASESMNVDLIGQRSNAKRQVNDAYVQKKRMRTNIFSAKPA